MDCVYPGVRLLVNDVKGSAFHFDPVELRKQLGLHRGIRLELVNLELQFADVRRAQTIVRRIRQASPANARTAAMAPVEM